MLAPLTLVLKSINFYEWMIDDPNNYKIMILVCFIFLVCAGVLSFYAFAASVNQRELLGTGYCRKIANIVFLVLMKVLALPFIGLSVNVLYCDSDNRYHQGQ